MRYAVVRNFMGEIEIEETYDTREEAQAHVDLALEGESFMCWPTKSIFIIDEVEEQ